jgi:RNA polymerase sigma-70 factor (ECF subfamily)
MTDSSVESISERPSGAIPTKEFLALFEQAQAGSSAALGELINTYRNYLLSIAHQELGSQLRVKVAPSDIVQESCMEAARGFATFQGRSRDELFMWLRGILLHNLSNARRRYFGTAKRQANLEITLGGETKIGEWEFASEQESPSRAAMRRERQIIMEQSLERLPELLREAILLRHRDHLSFAEMGDRLQRSAEAARKLWSRGIEQLQKEVGKIRADSHDGKV